ncbi:hypothetical protein ACNKHW_12790 [Shigella flexneri]
MDGVVDLGIIGENVLEEELIKPSGTGTKPALLHPAPSGFRRLPPSLAAPVDFSLQRCGVSSGIVSPPLTRSCSNVISIRRYPF